MGSRGLAQGMLRVESVVVVPLIVVCFVPHTEVNEVQYKNKCLLESWVVIYRERERCVIKF